MADTPEMKALLKAIEKIDKQVEWREKRIADDQAEIARLLGRRDDLAWSYRRHNMIQRGEDPDA